MEQLTTLLTALAEKLGTTVEYLWCGLLKQAYIEGILNIIYCVITIILLIVSYKYAKYFSSKWKEWTDKYEAEETLPSIILGTLIVCTLILLGASIFEFLPTAITAFNNPEYWALKEILKQL